MNNRFCIVIPVYKTDLSITEELSFRNFINTFKNKDNNIFFICPDDLDTTAYDTVIKNELSKKDKLLIERKNFDAKYFKSEFTYSQLCVNYDFYSSFDDYDYMLIWQFDCYLFNDNIEKWCDKGYDYIGAPIISEYSGWKSNNDIVWKPKVGNGGLSLRKISTFKDVTNPEGEFLTYYKSTYNNNLFEKLKFEDVYFYNVFRYYWDANIPSWEDAGKFALDMNPEVYVNFVNDKEFLPMACHAWPKNIRFWKDKIKEIDNNIIDYCEDKYKEFFKLYYGEKDSKQ